MPLTGYEKRSDGRSDGRTPPSSATQRTDRTATDRRDATGAPIPEGRVREIDFGDLASILLSQTEHSYIGDVMHLVRPCGEFPH